MEEVISSLFFLFFILFLVKIANKQRAKGKNVRKPTTIASRVEMVRPENFGSEQQAAVRAAKSVKPESPAAAAVKYRGISSDIVRDSQDDWLSQQLKEEQRALREVSAMFQLKNSHVASCDAEALRKASRH